MKWVWGDATVRVVSNLANNQSQGTCVNKVYIGELQYGWRVFSNEYIMSYNYEKHAFLDNVKSFDQSNSSVKISNEWHIPGQRSLISCRWNVKYTHEIFMAFGKYPPIPTPNLDSISFLKTNKL